jgi:hypothetical protein
MKAQNRRKTVTRDKNHKLMMKEKRKTSHPKYSLGIYRKNLTLNEKKENRHKNIHIKLACLNRKVNRSWNLWRSISINLAWPAGSCKTLHKKAWI